METDGALDVVVQGRQTTGEFMTVHASDALVCGLMKAAITRYVEVDVDQKVIILLAEQANYRDNVCDGKTIADEKEIMLFDSQPSTEMVTISQAS